MSAIEETMETNQSFDYSQYLKNLVKKNAEITILKAKEGNYFPDEKMPKAYNGISGNTYGGVNSLLLDISKKRNGYETNCWINKDKAKFLGVKKDELNNARYGVNISYIKTKTKVPVYEKDENGNKIPVIDKNGFQKVSKNGVLMHKIATEISKDKDGKINYMADGVTPFKNFKYETIDIEPIFTTKYLYNIEQFPSLDKSKLQERNSNSKDYVQDMDILRLKDLDLGKKELFNEVASYVEKKIPQNEMQDRISLLEKEKLDLQNKLETLSKRKEPKSKIVELAKPLTRNTIGVDKNNALAVNGKEVATKAKIIGTGKKKTAEAVFER